MELIASLVVPTRNRRTALEHVVPTLAAQTVGHDAYEILVCDGGSDDGTRECLAAMKVPNLRVLACGPGGRGAARNEGLRNARGTVVLFTDADILAEPDWIDRHVAAHARHPGSAIVGCEVQVDSLDEYEAVRRDPRGRRTLHAPSRRRLPWFFFLTGNASVRRDALLQVGGFDEAFTDYGHEDLELGYRLERIGVRLRYEPRAVNYHWHPQTPETRLAKMEASGRATVRMFRKHRDRRILWRMGVNPASRLLHALACHSDWGRAVRAGWCPASRVARSLALQYAYLDGVTRAWSER